MNNAVFRAQLTDVRNDDRHKGFLKLTFHVPDNASPGLYQILAAMAVIAKRGPSFESPLPFFLAAENFSPTEELSPVSSADQTQTGNNGVMFSPDSSAENCGGIPPEKREPNRTTPEAELKQSPGHFTTQAAIMIGRRDFRTFLAMGTDLPTIEEADRFIKEYCGIKSKKELIPNTPAGKKWDELAGLFYRWSQGDNVRP